MLITLLFERNFALYGILILFTAGILDKLFAAAVLSRMIKESENLGTAGSNLLKQIKLKYESCYRLNLQINNVPAFINKYIYNYKVLGISLRGLNSLGDICFLLCALLGMVSGLTMYIYTFTFEKTAFYAALSLILAFCGFIWSRLMNINEKSESLTVNIQDYLENSLENKLRSEALKSQEEKSRIVVEVESPLPLPVLDQTAVSASQVNFEGLKEHEFMAEGLNSDLIDEILKEYLA